MKHIFSFSKNKERERTLQCERDYSLEAHLVILSSDILLISFISYFFTGEIDQSNLSDFSDMTLSNSNSLGKIGAVISDFFIYKGFGVSSIIFSFLIFISALKILLRSKKKKYNKKLALGFLLNFSFFNIFWSLLIMETYLFRNYRL